MKAAKRFKAALDTDNSGIGPQLQISAFDHAPHPIVRTETPYLLSTDYRWGLIPPDWNKDPKDIWNNTVNARLETLEDKYAWRLVSENRCLIPVTGYYEHHWNDARGKSKTKFIIHHSDTEIFALAGLYASWESKSGEMYHTYTVCTTTGNDIMKFVHNKDAATGNFRMPVMLNPEDERQWLDTSIHHMDFSYPNYQPKLVAFPYDGEPAVQTGLFDGI